jgi:two-component system, cell cycle sensor histidine kinase and response regulator CckA
MRAATILYVEDETFVREVTQEVLESAGYRVLAAGTTDEADRLYRKLFAEIDLLLTDVILPGENGRAFAARLRQTHPLLKIVLSSGYGEQMGTREGWEDGLAKPFSSEALLLRVRHLLDQHVVEPECTAVMPACGGA